MTEKKKPEPDDPEQSERFVETAKDVGADETGEAFDRMMKSLSTPKLKQSDN